VTVSIHADGDDRGRAIGKPTTGAMTGTRDPAVAVPLAKRLLQTSAWKTVPRTGSSLDKAKYLLRAKGLDAALQVLPDVAIAALTRNPRPGGCHWCTVDLTVRLSFGKDTEPERNEHTLAFLGNPCAQCRHRHATDDAIVAAVERFTTLTAAGVPPATAARAHDPRAAEWLLAQAKGQAPRLPVAATGAIWPAGRPPRRRATVAAGAGGSRAPDPRYYRPYTQAEVAARYAQAEAEDADRRRQQADDDQALEARTAAIVDRYRWERGDVQVTGP
jgi:hypothetical protein